MSGEPIPAESRNLIEGARVPEVEVIALQKSLNARVRAGELSGPLLSENGKLDMATEAKHRELSAVEAIAAARIPPAMPADEVEATAKEADKAIIREAREELEHIADTPYMNFDHKAPTLARIKALEAAFKRKWEASPIPGQIAAALRDAIRPGQLLKADLTFDYGRMEHHMRALQVAEALLGKIPAGDALYATMSVPIDAYRAAFLLGLVPGEATPRAGMLGGQMPAAALRTAPPPPPPRAAATPDVESPATADRTGPLPPRKLPTRELSARELSTGPLRDPIREKQNRDLDMMGPERRMGMLREIEAHMTAGNPPDPFAGRIAASLSRTHPEALTAIHAGMMDDEGLLDFALRLDDATAARVAPKTRLGMVKSLVGRVANGEGAGQAAGALAASLVRQHPNVLAELVANTDGEGKGAMLLHMTEGMADDELARLPKEGLMAMAKSLGGGGAVGTGTTMPGTTGSSTEERRQVARLMRLATSRR